MQYDIEKDAEERKQNGTCITKGSKVWEIRRSLKGFLPIHKSTIYFVSCTSSFFNTKVFEHDLMRLKRPQNTGL